MRYRYQRQGTAAEERERVAIVMPKEELEAIDRWGVPAGLPSRTAAIRQLLRKGLEAVTKSERKRDPQ